ncbi:MAG: bifunctional diaminohydroxyphosphoribosylaminopyrimidine deaminase/5-amino-6-(5-phosphoribosylamino)uracil reductase RibD [Vicinamibacteria bacterium]|nr:bifunctional diaminohydroxyphosphoribosylaminopyrimidine deaminase/5-amino-6-(5-phosphoribosylamino)uracil reductase RibD [Vicinamibacteria bacterium]
MKKRALAADDERFMRRALALAERGIGETNPNPPVGCVLVREGRVVGEGFHERAGSPHAEANALARAGGRASGATAYVTLEPCAPNPAKRTPPCAPRLVGAGVARVVFGARDFNPGVRGAGVRLLRAAGVEVMEGVCAAEAERLVAHFNTAMRNHRPFVALKAGMTLDGCTATSTGESKWITSAAQRNAARKLRRLFDGVLVGVETALHDDPMLLPSPRTRRPFARVVLDSKLRLPLDSKLVTSARRHPLIVVGADGAPRDRRQALEGKGAAVLLVPGRGGRVSIEAAVAALFDRSWRSLLVEGGSEVLGSFVRERLFDEMVIFRAPLVLGGRGSRPVVGGPNPAALADAARVKRASAETSATLRYGLGDPLALEVEVYERRPDARSRPEA